MSSSLQLQYMRVTGVWRKKNGVLRKKKKVHGRMRVLGLAEPH